MQQDSLVQIISAEMKSAMRAKDKLRLATLRLIVAAFRQVEVDERVSVDNPRACSILSKMAKQRRESITQFNKAGRSDLEEQEQYELKLILSFLPEPLTEQQVDQAICSALSDTDAKGMKDMGRVMAILNVKLKDRADLSQVSQKVRQILLDRK